MGEVKTGRGRQKGQTKNYTIIKDPLLSPYEIQVDESSFNLMKPNAKGGLDNFGYFSSLEGAVRQVVRDEKMPKGKILTLREYITEYRNETQKLIKALEL